MRFWKTLSVPGTPTVGMVVATYEQANPLGSLVFGLRAQTYSRFRCLVVHDGPATEATRAAYRAARQDDTRFEWIETKVRENKFGHPGRAEGLARLAPQVDYIGTTNGDGWYVPVYFEAMLHALVAGKKKFAFSNLIHSHRQWSFMDSKVERGRIDAGNWIVDSRIVATTPWTDYSFAGDWAYISRLVKTAGPVAKVKGTFFIHS